MFYRTTYSDVSDMPPADWCVTTLHTLSNKYEHLADSRKVNPPFAEAVLNSFKSKLLNIISAPSFYDPEDTSEGETEWPLASDSAVYDGTSNYLTITPSAFIDSSSAVCYDKDADNAEDDLTTGLLSPSPSPTNAESPSCSYLDSDGCSAAGNASASAYVDLCDASSGLAEEDTGVLPPSIEEALRRFLANTNNQVLSDTFTTFVDAESPVDSSSSVVINEDEDDDSSNDAQIFSSESLSPGSPGSPEEPLDYLSTTDPVDIFVKSYSANGSWEALQSSSSESESSEDALLPPCKRKRSTNSEEIEEAEQNAASTRSSQVPRPKLLPLSPRKRSRSVSHNDVAAVPTAKAVASAVAGSSVSVVVVAASASANETTTAAA
ncbi:hypothetical protein LPJ64_001802 [Coemansia asiatica]|uniref:Uncharacterized protein n=1 Tax=Coemansia asiatica TaxID=1052880 RepID=A0A9W7XMU0_9FUNG|nr:hypothetical protein LPJ64_001802 [Coemansia asiatica]